MINAQNDISVTLTLTFNENIVFKDVLRPIRYSYVNNYFIANITFANKFYMHVHEIFIENEKQLHNVNPT